MWTYINLFIDFLKVGLFSFGGGYAMIPLIKDIVEKDNLLNTEVFFNIIGVAAMAPGSIAVNGTTAIGFLSKGMLGAVILVVAIVLPSFILSLLMFSVMSKIREYKIVDSIFYFLRPTVLAMIVSAGVFMGNGVLFSYNNTSKFNVDISFVGGAIFLVSLIIALKTKIHPVLLICVTGILGGIFL